jgi:hypothetical protein
LFLIIVGYSGRGSSPGLSLLLGHINCTCLLSSVLCLSGWALVIGHAGVDTLTDGTRDSLTVGCPLSISSKGAQQRLTGRVAHPKRLPDGFRFRGHQDMVLVARADAHQRHAAKWRLRICHYITSPESCCPHRPRRCALWVE